MENEAREIQIQSDLESDALPLRHSPLSEGARSACPHQVSQHECMMPVQNSAAIPERSTGDCGSLGRWFLVCKCLARYGSVAIIGGGAGLPLWRLTLDDRQEGPLA
jgi:hypothetical protein